MGDDETPERREIEELLAWHAAGALTPQEARRVEAALARDPELRRSFEQASEELAVVITENEALGAPSPRAMDELFAKIDREPRRARALRASLLARLAAFWDSLSPRTLAWAAVAAGLVIVLQATVIAAGVTRGGSSPASQYATASATAPAAVGPGAYALVRFSPQATTAEVTALLQASHAAIVDGPTQGGLYRVRVAAGQVTPERRAALVQQLQAAKGVELAVPAE
ncbi:MAG: hypothetical protein ACJ798_06830 [Phenylobacterium sp.]